MPISTIANLGDIITQALAAVRVRLPGKNTDLASYLGAQARAWAMGLFGFQRTAEAIDRESPPNQKTSPLGIQTWAEISGVPSNQGGYGGNGAVPSSGGLAPVTGTATTSVLAGQLLTAPDSVTIIELVADVTIPATGSFQAVTPGKVGNLPAGTKLTWQTPPTGCDPTVTLTAGLSGGDDVETPASLFSRLQEQWQAPPKGGADTDYDEWSIEILGVDKGYVYGRRGGTGTVHIVITQAGSGRARLPSGTLIDSVQAFIDKVKPADVDEALVMAPEMPSDRGLTIIATAFLATGYQWDWNDQEAGGPWSVSSYSGAGPITLTLNAPPPLSLTTAIDNGLQPFIQVLNTNGGGPLPQQVRVTAHSGNVLTLLSALTPAPNVADGVFAGSYAAPAAAAAIIAFVDSLGPSRISGFADVVTQWDDVASIWGCGTSVVNVKDVDGVTRMVSRLAGVDGLLIQVGSGFTTSDDFEPDDTYLVGPEMAWVANAIVVQATL